MRKPDPMMIMKLIGTIALVLCLAACNLPQTLPSRPISIGIAGPQTWIDAPLDNMHIPLAPYEVVFHATDDSAITQVELWINDQQVVMPPLSESGNNLVTVKFTWSPAVPGQYTLRARSQNLAGGWSDEALVTVWVGDLTPTATITPSITLTTTPTLTLTPTTTSTPTNITFIPTISANQFYYGGCKPTSIDFLVTVSGGEVDSVVLFLKLNDQSGSGSTGWMAFDSMKPKGNGIYKLTVVSSQIEGYDNYAAAWVIYQFVATYNNVVVGRSESFTDVVLSACNITPLLPPVLPPLRVIPTAITPQIIK